MRIIARDCSPLQPQPTAAEAEWLRRLATSVRARDLAIPFTDERDDEPIVYCAWDGTWWAGRYVGALSFEGNQLTIEPRFGLSTLRNWLFEATSVVLTDSPGQLRQDESFIVQLLATVWAHGFVEAARIVFQHGEVRGIVDAKYKSIHPTARAPQGPQREDLYQIAAYLGRYATNVPTSALGVLAFPHDPSMPTVSFAESHSPWNLSDGKKVFFVALPHDPVEATEKLRKIFQ